jgi:hypothetical protein
VGSSATTTYIYDDADRLTEILWKNSSGANTQRSVFTYDGLSRKKKAQEYSWSSGAWQLDSTIQYVHDGLDIIQERNASNAVTATLVRDGNIGGILARTVSGANRFYHYDGSGNVVQVTKGDKTTMAEYGLVDLGVT